MISPLSILLYEIDMPDPPIPGGTEFTEWWRIIGLIAVTVLTTGILALIFRPAVPATDGDTEADGGRQDVGSNGGLFTLTPMRRAGDPRPAGVIPFPARGDSSEAAQTSGAAAERLRRVASRATQSQSEEAGERRRLGSGLVAREEDAAIEESLRPTDMETAPGNEPGPSEPASDMPLSGPTHAGEGGAGFPGTRDSLDLLGDLADRLPSTADRALGGSPANEEAPSRALDLESEQVVPEPSIMHGSVPTAADVDKISDAPPPGKIVQFVPRTAQSGPADIDPAYELLNEVEREQRAQTDSVLTQFPVDLSTREDVTATVQELLFCANVGEFLHGFALYTDRFLFKFMDQSGLNEDEFRERFSSVEPKDPAEWTRVDSIREFRRLEDGRISAHVRYVDGGTLNGIERYVFKRDPITNRWLIDDIAAVD